MEVFFDSAKYLLSQPWWVDIAKIVLGMFMLVGSLVAFYVSLKFPEWFEQLVLLEKLADTSRDDVMFEMTAARARLAKVKKSLEVRHQSAQSIDVKAVLAENVVPILALLLQRERTLAQVGALAGKIGMTAVNQILRKMKGK